MATPTTVHSPKTGLVRGLGLWSATAIVVGDTIGTGVFLVASDMARAVGTATLVLTAWVLGLVIVLFGAFCYAELGAAFPKAGGPYVYLSRGLGPIWGFLFGWMSSVLERPVAMAALGAGFIRFLSFFIPALENVLFTAHVGGGFDFTLRLAQPLAAMVVVIVTAVNYFSVRMSGAIQVLVTTLKVGTILIIIAGGMIFGTKHASDSVTTNHFGIGTIAAVLTALVPAMWAYNGFNDLGAMGEEISDPQRNIHRSIILGLVTVGGLYVMANVTYFRVLPFAAVAGSQHVASDAVQTFAGSAGAAWLTAGMGLSALGALHVVILTGARIPYAMARDGVFFQFAERIHPRFHTPSGALIVLGSIATLLTLTGTFEELYSLFVFAVWIFLALNAIALLRLRRKEPELARPYRVWGYPWTPVIFLVAAVALTVNLWIVRPVRSSAGLLVILSGVPLFYRWRSRAKRLNGP
jgi:APA family basic amino acid/polyamine antiporter